MCSLIVGGFPNLLALRDQIKYNLFENMYKNRTFGVQILSFHCTDYIESIINIFLPLVDKIAISVNEKRNTLLIMGGIFFPIFAISLIIYLIILLKTNFLKK